jgi:hypothetical protein
LLGHFHGQSSQAALCGEQLNDLPLQSPVSGCIVLLAQKQQILRLGAGVSGKSEGQGGRGAGVKQQRKNGSGDAKAHARSYALTPHLRAPTRGVQVCGRVIVLRWWRPSSMKYR